MKFTGSFGDWLKQRRKALDLTQAELADQIGCSVVTIRKIESANARPSKAFAERLADVLAISDEDRTGFVKFARQPGATSSPAEPPRSNLPPEPNHFIGRTEELAQIGDYLADPTCRLLTLVGVGGIGKTRLALQVGARLLNQAELAFPDGVFFVALQPLTSPDFMLSALAEAIGLHFYPGAEPLLQLLDYLQSKAILLILDNFEHLLDGLGLVTEIFKATPNIKILATSRERLNLHEEWLHQVRGLSYPEAAQAGDPEDYGAVKLFAQSARRVRPDFLLSAEESAVLRICQLVEGMPLALEMSAAWLARLPAGEIVREIERGLDILESPARNVAPRHRSMRAVFEHSWSLLTDAEQDVFKKLSIFRGGFRREATEAVAGGSLRLLSALVDKSLLRVDSTGRYDLHELLRQFAEEQLNTSPETSQQVQDLHSQYYMNFVAERENRIRIQHLKDVIEELRSEFDNVRAAWDWAIETQQLEDFDRKSTGVMLLHDGLKLDEEAEKLFDKAAAKLRSGPYLPLILVLHTQAWLNKLLGHYDKAIAQWEEGLSVCRRYHQLDKMSWMLLGLSQIALTNGDLERARQLGQESLDSFREDATASDITGTSIFGNMGLIAGRMGNFPEARRWLEESMLEAQKFENRVGIADARNKRGQVELMAKMYLQAKQIYLDNLVYQREIDYPRGEILSLLGIAKAARELDDDADAGRYFAEAFKAAFVAHQIPNALEALTGIAELLIQGNDQAQAARFLALVLHHRATNHETKNRAQRLLAELEAEPSSQVVAAIKSGKSRQLSDGQTQATMTLEQVITYLMKYQKHNSR